ncbi:serine protease [Maribacter sp. MJ134]|uniref:trypsin-like serine peptidase n=1 Tax=Maribacter sp. MJ134 TaxID=2496865 RepID=UPI000F84957F|nr:serine protease [Maribacter sp. MJ134]AZQ58096.1 serine protease [Maribacter sp. MJ134]
MRKWIWYVLFIIVFIGSSLSIYQCKASKNIKSIENLKKMAKSDVVFRQQVLFELQERNAVAFTNVDYENRAGNIINMSEDRIEFPVSLNQVDLNDFTSSQLLEMLPKEVDNRQDYFLVGKKEVKENFSGVAMVMKKSSINDNGFYTSKQYRELVFRLNGQDYKGCASYRFIDQFRIANCTAFAISPYHILTVGHEVNDKNCYDYEFVFDMYMSVRDEVVQKIPIEQRFIVDYPVDHVFDSITMMDYTILRVLKKIPEKRILRIDLNEDYLENERLYAIGASEGLPLKYSPDGQIFKSWSEDIINTNLNVHVGNSGSPVFNTENNVVGMVVKGQSKQKVNKIDNCIMPKDCIDFGCSGEYVLKISSIPTLKELLKKNDLL